MQHPSRRFLWFVALSALLLSFLASPTAGQDAASASPVPSTSLEPSLSPSASPVLSPSPDTSVSPSSSPVLASATPSASPVSTPSPVSSPSATPSEAVSSPSASASPAGSPSSSPSAVITPSATPSVSASPVNSPSTSPSPSISASPSLSPSPSPSANATLVSAPVEDDDDDDHWWDHVSNRAAVGLVVAFAVPIIVVGAIVAAYITYKAYNRRRFIETGAAPPTRDVEAEMERYPNPVFSIDETEDEDHHL